MNDNEYFKWIKMWWHRTHYLFLQNSGTSLISSPCTRAWDLDIFPWFHQSQVVSQWLFAIWHSIVPLWVLERIPSHTDHLVFAPLVASVTSFDVTLCFWGFMWPLNQYSSWMPNYPWLQMCSVQNAHCTILVAHRSTMQSYQVTNTVQVLVRKGASSLQRNCFTQPASTATTAMQLQLHAHNAWWL